MGRVLVATSNAGKLRDFAGAAASGALQLAALPGFSSLPSVVEDGRTFEENARKKAEHYSRFVSGELVIADDSGLEVAALNGDPGVRSARYASGPGQVNADDPANNQRLLTELAGAQNRGACFVCVIAAARDGHTMGTFRGEASGVVLLQPRGNLGFGYDPLFYIPEVGKTFAELAPDEKAAISHRGRAYRAFLAWYQANSAT
jgi:XTP/dITP diphosphohydrolase